MKLDKTQHIDEPIVILKHIKIYHINNTDDISYRVELGR